VRIYNVPEFTTPVSQKNFFKGDKVQLKWNDNGTSLLVLAQTEVDKTGKSYYGETTLYLLSANGGFDSRIDLDKEGPVHDVSWSPKSTSFAVVYGYMPAKTVIFNNRAQAVHTFALGPRNTVLYSPHGRFILVAGFGNLAGQMDIYDLEKDMNKICTIEASNASVCEWSPDGLHILTATTSPRLRVDNGVRIWHAGGPLMYNEEFSELYHVTWRPQPTSAHPVASNPFSPIPAPQPSALQYMGAKKTPSKPVGAYRPPGARGSVTPLSFKREDEGGAAHVRGDPASYSHPVNGFGKGRGRTVPGAELADEHKPLPPGAAPGGGVSLTGTGEGADGEMSKAAKKNAKKREAKKAAAAAAAKEPTTNNALAPDDKRSRNRSRSRSGSHSPNRAGEWGPSKDGQRSRSKGYQPPREGGEGKERRERSRSNVRRNRGESNVNGSGVPHRERQSQYTDVRKEQPNGTMSNHNSHQQIQPPPGLSNPTRPKAPAPIDTKTLIPPPIPQSEAPEIDITLPTPTTPGGGANSTEKKVRGLLKKIRAIDDLKMRLAGGEKLEDTQMRKIESEDSVRGELRGLGMG
jgi:translation initiation factor 2A